MALVVKNRVKETTTSTGTGTITLAGAPNGYQTFSAIGDGNTTYYTIADQVGTNWEVGIGTYTASGTTLSRDSVLASSNGGSLVNFGSGSKDVFCTYPAETSVFTSNNPGTSGQVLVSQGSGVAPSWQSIPSANLQTFSSTGTSTWTKPANATFVVVEVWGAGGGGGSGRKPAASNAATGGDGGAGGAYIQRLFIASELPSAVTVTVGAGGSGGAAVSAAATNGNPGSPGGNSQFGPYVTSYGGRGGAGGTAVDGSGTFGSGVLSVGATARGGEPGINISSGSSSNFAAGQFGGAAPVLATSVWYGQHSGWGGAAGALALLTNYQPGGASFQGGSGGGAGSAVTAGNASSSNSSAGGCWVSVPANASNSAGGGGFRGTNGVGGPGQTGVTRGGGGGGISASTNLQNLSGYLAFGNGRVALISSRFNIYSTNNGTNWTVDQASPCTGNVIYDGSRWIQVDTLGAIYTSTDYSSWTASGQVPYWINNASETVGKIVYTNSVYFALGTLGSIFVSEDLISWARYSSGVSTRIYDVVWDGTYYVAVGTNVITRGTSYTSWTVTNTTARINYAIASNGSGVLVVSTNQAQGAYYSTDNGNTWPASTTTLAAAAIQGNLIHDGTQFVYMSSGGAIWTSTDGDTWTSRTAVGANALSIVYTGTNYVVSESTGANMRTKTDVTVAGAWASIATGAPNQASFRGGIGGIASGGGGGGAGLSTLNSGAGGAGGNGLVRVYTW